MNKRCTNSACRSTFSTLNFNGQCPFCGKAYPQLKSSRKQELSPRKPNSILIHRKNGYYRLKLNLDDVRKLVLQDRNIEGFKKLRELFQKTGYKPEYPRDLLAYVKEIKAQEEDKTAWFLLTKKDGYPQKAKVLRMRIE